MARVVTMTPQAAVEVMRDAGISTSPETVRAGIKQGVFPFGDYIQAEKSPVYIIYKRKLEEWLEERVVKEE